MSLDLLNALEANYGGRNVGISEFVESKKYCGKILYPRQRLLLKLIFLEELTAEEERILDYWIAGGRNQTEVQVSPFIRERIQWCRDNGYKHFREIVLVGGRRCSKGFITGHALAKLMFDTLQLNDPAAHYGIDSDKEIYFSCIATSQDQAKKYQYADLFSAVNSCQAMQRYIGKMQELEFSVKTESDIRKLEAWKRQGRKVIRDTAKLRGTALPANMSSIRGSATMAAVFDEFAFFMQGESAQSDNECYEALKPSLDQFRQDALLFCNSSPYSKVGKFYERYEVGMETDNGAPAAPNVLALRFPSWSLFEGWWEDPLYVGPKKCITVSPDWDENEIDKETGEYFYTPEDRQAIIIAREEERQNPDKYKVERRGNFAETIDAYLNPERVDQMYAGRPLPDASGYEALRTNWNDSTYLHRYKAHLDPSSTTAGFGFSLGHVENIIVNGLEQQHVVFDIIKRWRPQEFPNGVIDWETVITELLGYIDIFRPYEVTFDQFQSANAIQYLQRELRARGIETRVYEKTATAKTNWNRAETFRTALYMGLVHAPYDTEDNDWSSLELKFLQEIKTGLVPRVDKQEVGPVQTKDMADCIMECVEALIGNVIATQARVDLAQAPIRGAGLGGYPIGGPDAGGKGQHPLGRLYAKRSGEQAFGTGMSGRRARQSGASNRAWGAKPGYRRPPGR